MSHSNVPTREVSISAVLYFGGIASQIKPFLSNNPPSQPPTPFLFNQSYSRLGSVSKVDKLEFLEQDLVVTPIRQQIMNK